MARVKPVAAQRGADRGRRDLHAKPLQLALDPLVAPAGVLPGQADDQLLHLLVQWRPAGLAVWVGPGAGDQPTVPAQQRLGLDQEAGPAGSGEHPADRGEQGSVGGLELGTWALAAEHGDLVAQDEDLQVLGGVAAGEQGEELDGAAYGEVGEFRQHQVSSAGGRRSATVPTHAPPETTAHGSRLNLRTPHAEQDGYHRGGSPSAQLGSHRVPLLGRGWMAGG